MIGVALADVHVVPDADDVGHEGDHVGGLADGLAVGDLALASRPGPGRSRPSRLQAEAKEKRVRVELSRNREMPRPDSKILVEMLCSRRYRRASATVKTASSSSSVFSQVQEEVGLVHVLDSSELVQLVGYILHCLSYVKLLIYDCSAASGRPWGPELRSVDLPRNQLDFRRALLANALPAPPKLGTW